MDPSTATVPVIILCGGKGTRLREETETKPKPMVEIGGLPIVEHIIRRYRAAGFRFFVLAAGYKGEQIRDYAAKRLPDVRVEDTGQETQTGGRLARSLDAYLGDAEHFAVTYGDGLADVDLAAQFAFHLGHGRRGTMLGVHPPSRFGELRITGHIVTEFSEKPQFSDRYINGGYMFFHRAFRRYLSTDEGCVLETEPLSRLARDCHLSAYRHEGFWACMDTARERDELQALWDSGKAPWV